MLPLLHAYSTTFKLLIYFNTVRIRFLKYLNQWNKMIIILALCQFNAGFVFKWCHNRVGYYATFSFSQSVFCEKQTNKQTKTKGKQQQRKESGILESYVSVSNIDRSQHRNVTAKDCTCVTPRHSWITHMMNVWTRDAHDVVWLTCCISFHAWRSWGSWEGWGIEVKWRGGGGGIEKSQGLWIRALLFNYQRFKFSKALDRSGCERELYYTAKRSKISTCCSSFWGWQISLPECSWNGNVETGNTATSGSKGIQTNKVSAIKIFVIILKLKLVMYLPNLPIILSTP